MASNNNGNMFDIYGLQQVAEAIKDAFQQNYTLAQNEFAKDTFQQIIKLVKDPNNLTKKDIEEVFSKYLVPLLRGTYGGSNDFTNFMNVFKTVVTEMQRKENMTAVLLSNLLSGGVSLGYSTSARSIANGNGNKPFNLDKPKDSLTAAIFEKIFGQSAKSYEKLDSIEQSLREFFNAEKSNKKTKQRQFVEDLVDGLGKSKFIGGVFTDVIRLVSFFAASWFKQFGTLGKVIAVGLVAGAPLLAAALVNAFTKMLTNLLFNVAQASFSWISNLLVKLIGQSAFGSAIGPFSGLLGKKAAVAAGGALLTGIGTAGSSVGAGLITGLGSVGMGTGASITGVAGAATGAGLVTGLGTMGTTAAGIGAAGAATGATAIGAATGATAGAGAVAGGGLAAVLAPILAIAAAVALIAGTVVVIVKNWDKIKEFFEKTWEKLGEIKSSLGEWWQSKLEDFNDYLDEHPLVDKALGPISDAVRSAVEPDTTTTISETGIQFGDLTLTKGGAPVNMRDFSQKGAARQLEALRSADKERFDYLYDIVPEGFASLNDFTNDVIMTNKDTGEKGALLYKGAKDDLQVLRDYLVTQGMNKEKAAALVYTSGISTKGSPHVKGGQHDNPLGMSFDLAGKGWSQEDYALALPVIKSFYKDWDTAEYEAKVNGKGKFTTPNVSMNNAHFHVGVAPNKSSTKHDELSSAYDEWYAESQKQDIKIKEAEGVKEEQDKLENKTNEVVNRINKQPIADKESTKTTTPSVITKGSGVDVTGNEMTSRVFNNILSVQQYNPAQY